MNCTDFLARHSEYADGLLDASSTRLFAAHVQDCASCRRYHRIVQRGGQLARELLPVVQVSSEFESRVRHRLYHVRDEMAARSQPSFGLYAAVASFLFVGTAAAALAIAAERTPVVDGGVVFAAAPPSVTPIETNVVVTHAMPALSMRMAKTTDEVAPIEAEAKGHDPHVATPTDWPVYRRGAVAVAFPAPRGNLVARPADLRQSGLGAPVAPLLIRH